MTVFDYTVLGVVILSGFFAYARGFVREALSIAAWINASFIALYAFPYVVPLFEKVLPKGLVANAAAAAVVFILALMVLHMLASRLARRVKDSALSPVDRTLGLIFGLARGMILVCIGYILIGWMLPTGKDQPRWFAEARSAPFLDAGADKLRAFVPLPPTRGTAPRSTASGSAADAAERAARMGEKEAQSVINSFRNPAPNAAPPAKPAYTPEAQRELNRLILQQNAK